MALNTLGHRAQRPRAKSWSVFAITRVSGHPHDWPRALFAHQQYCLALRSQRVYHCSLPKSAPKTLGHWRSRHHRRRATFLQQRWQSHSNTPGKPGSSRTPFKPGKQDILDRLSGVLSLRNNNIRDQLTCIPFSRASSLLFPPHVAHDGSRRSFNHAAPRHHPVNLAGRFDQISICPCPSLGLKVGTSLSKRNLSKSHEI